MSATTLPASLGGAAGDLRTELTQARIVDRHPDETAGCAQSEAVYPAPVATAQQAAREPARVRSNNAVPPTNGEAADYSVQLRGVARHYGERTVLSGFDLSIERGSFVAIVGRSGCGKSTLLRLIAGLEKASSGVLEKRSADGGPFDTRIMFQDARLLPWKSVLHNVMLGLGRSAREEARAVLAEVGLLERANDWPAQLSGGQRQRVALARALVHRPQLLLLDEPLGALDALTRIEMHALIERLWREQRFTALLVTHDVHEAVALGERILLIEAGRIALDQPVPLARPRARASAGFAALEAHVLQRVLKRAPDDGALPHRAFDAPGEGRPSWPTDVRWAV